MNQSLSPGTFLIDIALQRPLMGACYLVGDSGEFALVDTGTNYSAPAIMETLAQAGGAPEQVRWIIPTHVHLDHAGGTGKLMQLCPNATAVAHPKGHPHLVDPSKLQAGATAVYGEAAFARDFGKLVAIDADRILVADDGQAFDLGKRELAFHYSPGHANHHGCIHDRHDNVLYTGDTFGLAYSEFLVKDTPYIIATTSPVAFDPDAWFDSLDRLMALQPAAVRLTHYGEIRAPERHVDTLRESIRAHVEIALAEEKRDAAGREIRLQAALDELLVNAGVRHSGLPEEQVRHLLAGDIRLNAQGLAIWLARRAKAAA